MYKSGYVYSDNFKLQYIVDGSGAPAIVVGSSLYYERTFSKSLRTKLRMAFIDHRGFAPSNDCKDIKKYQLDILVDDIELLRKELGFEKFIMIGHSGHAFMALEYAKKYPTNVKHLVMMCTAPDYSDAGRQKAEQYARRVGMSRTQSSTGY